MFFKASYGVLLVCLWKVDIQFLIANIQVYWSTNIMRKLKFELDRNTLETIYLSLIRPIWEYADIVWDNCSMHEDLDKIQDEAARIVNEATQLVSLNMLHNDVCWDILQKRRQKHKSIQIFRMKNNL